MAKANTIWRPRFGESGYSDLIKRLKQGWIIEKATCFAGHHQPQSLSNMHSVYYLRIAKRIELEFTNFDHNEQFHQN
jgi:hypothetical protein